MKTIKSFISALVLLAAMALGASAQTSFPTLNGSRVDLSANKGKVVILSVGASWLPLSAKQAEYTNVLAKRYTGKDVVVYFVTTDSTDARSKNYASNDGILKFTTTTKLTVPVLRDSDGATILKLYNVDQLPSFVILDKQGKLVGQPFGGIDPKSDITIPISKAVDRLL
jgi:hypothetical protein